MSITKAIKRVNKLNNKVKQVLFGSLLGDGSISDEIRARFSEKHCLRQKDYLSWKKEILEKEFVFGEIFYDKNRKIFSIRSCGDIRLTQIRTIFYPNDKKIVIPDILEQLTPLALAVWFCDDGTYRYQNHQSVIYSSGFNHQQHLIIQKYFKEKWGIDCKLCIDSRRNWYTEFNATNTRKFLKLIKPIFEKYYVPKCMWYKLGHLYHGNQGKIELAKEKKREVSDIWYQKPEIRGKKRLYYQKHRNKILRQRKKYYSRPEIREKRKIYMEEYSKEYHRKNRVKINKYKREWRRKRKLKMMIEGNKN